MRARTGKENGRAISGENEEWVGVTGAYISESCESSDGDVKADKRWRILSHWV